MTQARNQSTSEESNAEDAQSSVSTKVLLVQKDPSGKSNLHAALEREGFDVVTRSTIREALSCIVNETFSALICDLHLPAASDGFTLVNAARHFHPGAITMILSDYPALRESVSALLPQADEVLVTPLPPHDIVELLKNRLREPKHQTPRIPERVATVLERNATQTIAEWLKRVKKSECLAEILLGDSARKGHLHTLLGELIGRLRKPHHDEGKAEVSLAALGHGRIRRDQGYTASMLVEESRILQVCIFQTLRNNLSAVDLALVLTDVMTIADEVDSQLTQTMESFNERATSQGASDAKSRVSKTKKTPSLRQTA